MSIEQRHFRIENVKNGTFYISALPMRRHFDTLPKTANICRSIYATERQKTVFFYFASSPLEQ
jgi:hypothetical protein